MAGRRLSINRRFPLSSSPSVEALSVDVRSHVPNTQGRDWLSYPMNLPRYPTSQPGASWSCIPTRCAFVGTFGRVAISRWLNTKAAGAIPFFPPREQAVLKAIACEAVSQTKLPLSWLSTSDLVSTSSIRPDSR
jgi:hypothetical protein